jgi:hypothetical protein
MVKAMTDTGTGYGRARPTSMRELTEVGPGTPMGRAVAAVLAPRRVHSRAAPPLRSRRVSRGRLPGSLDRDEAVALLVRAATTPNAADGSVSIAGHGFEAPT